MAQEHYTDAVRNKVDDRKIMPDEEIGQAVLLLQVLEQVQHLALHRNIQCGDRFIADDQVLSLIHISLRNGALPHRGSGAAGMGWPH